YQPATGSIDLLHWLTHIAPIMEDLSDTSFAWWQETTKDALSWYGQYSASTPLARLQLKPRPSSVLKPEWARVERRATAMMLSAVPKAIREEIIAHGQVSTLDLLCKLYSVYQPGNLQEKTLVLKMLEQPEECTSALQAVEGLRRWSLWRRRAASLGMAEPDASVLVRGLDKITGLIIKGSGELAFRVSLIRSTLQVDVSPSSSTVTTFLQHLQAEMEQQARLGASKGAADSQVSSYVGFVGEGSPSEEVPVLRFNSAQGAGETGSTSPTASSPSANQRKVNFDEDGVIQAKVLRALKELQGVPLFKSVMEKVKRWTSGDGGSRGQGRPALLDSGATHVLRAPKDEEEWNEAKDVNVLLAGDSVAAMKQNDAGSLLSGDQLAQVIVPLGRVITTLGYRLCWTSEKCELIGPEGDSLPLVVKNGCPEVSERVAHHLIQQLEAQELPRLEDATQSSVKAVHGLKASWWSYLRDYVKGGSVLDGVSAVDKAEFLDFKQIVKDQMVTRRSKLGIWELLKGVNINRRARKRLLRASGWIVRWDPPSVEKTRDPHKHLAFIGSLVYVNLNTMLVENEYQNVWSVIQWGAMEGKLSAIVARECCPRPLDQAVAGPHRSKDSLAYFMEMGLVDVSVDDFDGKRHVRLAKLSSDAAWNSAAGHQHRSTLHPMAYSLSVDVVGPLKGYGRSPDGKFFKYFVIGALRIPRVEGAHGHGEVRGHPLPPEEPEEEVLSDDEEADADPPDGAGVGLDDVDKEEKQWEDLKATFKKPLLTTTLYFAVPVNNKRAATMLPAVQKIVTDVKALGYPVTRIHSDRGGEFRGNLVRKWALASGMWPTTTSGSDSAANGVAEAGVRYLKRRARILLDSAGVDKSNWPTAVQYAAAQQRYEQLGELPPMPVAYGSKVYVKTKRYKTGAVEDFGPHWTRGRYVGPSSDIRGGHVILKESGTFIQTTHVRVTTDPPSLEEVTPTVVVEPDEPPEPPDDKPPLPPPAVPPRRVREKRPGVAKADGFYQEREQLPHELPVPGEPQEEEPQVMYMRLQEIQYVEVVAQQLCEAEKYTEKDCARLLALFAGTCGNLKVPRAPEGTGMILGAFVHGGNFGVTKYGRDLPWVTKYFNSYLMKKIEKAWPTLRCSWTTLAIQSAQQVPRHRDVHNERGTYNYVKTKTFEGLWVQGQDREPQVIAATKSREYDYEEYDGKLHEGHLIDVAKAPAVFDPLVPHAYVNEKNLKWFLSAYTPQGAYKLGAVDKDYLVSLRFPLDQVDQDDSPPCGALETRPVSKAISLPSETSLSGTRGAGDDVEVVPAGDCEMTMWDWAIYVEEENQPDEEEEEGHGSLLCLRRVCSSDDPGQVFPTLEQAAESLQDYEDAYPGSQDIEECVEYWASVGMHQHPRLAKLEPEYTEGIEEIIQRAVDAQARIVCCGNYAAEDQGELFAGGAAAESLRCALTYTAKRRWRAGITDITGAFMLTPLPTGIGEVVYIIRPPAALVQLGLADPSERWQLTHGMYGLRQSPKLWSAFRDGEMKKMIIEDEDTSWILKQGEAEPNMWLVYETGAPVDQEPEGVILIYVDDILLCGPLRLVRALSKAIRGTWKSSELELLEADHEIRFLGCEIAVSEEYDAVFIHQRPYIEEVLRLHETREVDQSPIQAPKELVTFEAFENEEPGSPDEIKQAQRACGELLWIAQRSRPDISFVVCAMGSLLTRAAPRCLQIAARLRSYLQRTKNLALALRPVGEDFAVYTDSSFAPSGAKSHSGLVAVWSGAPVCWRSARQPFTCLSTAECELLAATEGLVMGKSIESVINQMQKVVRISLRIDNQAAVSLAKPSSSTQRLEELIQIWGFVDVVTQECEYCPLNEPVDILTKAYLYEEINGR
ncbi:TY5A, partial [Symbiodinium microadriaticum]